MNIMRTLGIISTILFTSCYVPQIISILKTKNVSGISTGMWVIVVSGFTTGLFYVLWLEAHVLIISYILGFFLSLWTLVLVLYYRNKT